MQKYQISKDSFHRLMEKDMNFNFARFHGFAVSDRQSFERLTKQTTADAIIRQQSPPTGRT
jgi:hypothetical protein